MPFERPYKGLMPYKEDDAQFFFGRKREEGIITANLMAARITMLYGPSGVGKTSLLRAGVVHRLRQLAERNLTKRGNPKFAVVLMNSWRDDPVERLKQEARKTVRRHSMGGLPFRRPRLARWLIHCMI